MNNYNHYEIVKLKRFIASSKLEGIDIKLPFKGELLESIVTRMKVNITDRYNLTNDGYCYSGTSVLRNKFNIQDAISLEHAEKMITVHAIDKVCFASPPYSLRYMMCLHKTLFSEIYEWAGELRHVDISKGGTYFCTSRKIVVEADKLFSRLKRDKWLTNLDKERFCERVAEYYCEFNMIHPFREGNGRVQRIMFEHLLISAGYDVDWNGVGQQEWIQANIDGVNVDYWLATEIFKRIVSVR